MEQIRPTQWYEAYLFDLDGTIYLGEELLPGVLRTIELIQGQGKIVRFLSNNPTRTPEQYADKLEHLGIPVVASQIVNTVTTTLWWLQENHPDAVLFPIAEEPLCRALREAGFTLSDDPSKIDIVIASYDRNFVYRDLQIAYDTLAYHRRGILIQTNPDRFCPFPGGRGEPDAAAITAAIEACTEVECQASMGKPSPLILRAALAGLDVSMEDCLMTGDRLRTDIQMAIDAHMPTAVVFTGETQPEDVGEQYAGIYQLNTLDEIIPAWARD